MRKTAVLVLVALTLVAGSAALGRSDRTRPAAGPLNPDNSSSSDSTAGPGGSRADDRGITIGGIQFIGLPGGTFRMGNSAGVGENDELPVHEVRVDAFLMARSEVTYRQFNAFVDATEYKAPRRWQGAGDDYPVVHVSWEDATAFCVWFSRTYGVDARLPSEAEWEFAARGGLAGQIYSNGNILTMQDANFDSAGARPVGSYPANGYGLYDMAGNVWEWCFDWYGSTYYTVSPVYNPRGPQTGGSRILRGGSWVNPVSYLRVATRGSGSPAYADVHIGFRLVVAAGSRL
jgi:formylglycine-generating enzyme required for sulfatase activity